jgi:hypothetical protein
MTIVKNIKDYYHCYIAIICVVTTFVIKSVPAIVKINLLYPKTVDYRADQQNTTGSSRTDVPFSQCGLT